MAYAGHFPPSGGAPGADVGASGSTAAALRAHTFTHAHEDASAAMGLGFGLAFGVDTGTASAHTASGRVYPPATRMHSWASRFLPEHMYEYYAHTRTANTAALPPGHARTRDLPAEYISILPLDRDVEERLHVTGSFGYVSSVYKAVRMSDGCAYVVRRVEGVRAPHSVTERVCAAWAAANHPCIAPLRRVYQVGVGPSSALLFEHDYYACAKSLKELYLSGRGAALPEEKLWSIAIQLLLAIRAAHNANVSFRGLHAHRVLLHGHSRVAVTSAGVLDVLESDSPKPLVECQHADILSLGQLLLQLATRNPSAHAQTSIAATLEAVKTAYSPTLHALIVLLLSKPVPVHELCRLLAPQIMEELDAMYAHCDLMDNLLAREADNGRLLRLLMKLGFINERPSHEGDSAWAETGDRYLLKLYRDFVFHQVADEDRPVLDMAHVIESLNLLDAGSPEKVLLSSRDGNTILVSSYANLRSALNHAFDELRSSASHRGSASEAATGHAAVTASGHPGLSRGAARIRGRGRGRGGFRYTYHQQAAMPGLAAMLPGGLPSLPDSSMAAMAQMMVGGATTPLMGLGGTASAMEAASGDSGLGADFQQEGGAWMGAGEHDYLAQGEEHAGYAQGASAAGAPYADQYGSEGDYGYSDQGYGAGYESQGHEGAGAYVPADAANSQPELAEAVPVGGEAGAASLNVAAPEFRPSWLSGPT